MSDQLTSRIDRVCVSGGADLRALDRVEYRSQVHVRNDDARTWLILSHRDDHVRPRITFVVDHAAEVLTGGLGAEELFAG